MKKFIEGATGIFFFLLFMLVQFPGGTILMALACNTRRLDGWDWVLSVIVPGFGLAKVMFSSSCL